MTHENTFDIDEAPIHAALSSAASVDPARVRDILAKARMLKGLNADDIVPLMGIESPDLLEELFDAARYAKDTIYGRRLVLFAPLYISSKCSNDCAYCAFRSRNKALVRKALTQDEIAAETRILIDQGHKRVLLVAGEANTKNSLQYVLDAIKTIYSVKHGNGEIRRVNVNIAPLNADEFALLKQAKIGTYQIFQETYHHETYRQVHLGGKKKDYLWRLQAIDRAMTAGIDDCGIGVLFGLADWRFDLLGLMQHIRHLETAFGVGPHTISVPRMEPASGSELASCPPHPVSDNDFRKIVAILRLAVPYTGIIMSTRETPQMRRDTFALGVSQISAGSRTNPGGYNELVTEEMGQFSLGDHRPLGEVIRDVAGLGYIPSFCTGCYRLGRTGADFMDLAKPGDIKQHCDPNAASTFQEYLMDYGDEETCAIGERAIEDFISNMDAAPARYSRIMVSKVKQGKRDVYR
ncbi:MAG: [FeFe] hydrogenase H-cluster radical SAM maturase HydG [Azoarcus sp.]|nr:[FeFe] hydrogenase H-cluster radical SAM maturase HydG [Azoarcus sp.]